MAARNANGLDGLRIDCLRRIVGVQGECKVNAPNKEGKAPESNVEK